MHRRVLLFLGVLLFVPTMALATITITVGDWVMTPGTNNLIDVMIRADAGEGINSMDFGVTLNGNVPVGSLAVTGVDLNETNSGTTATVLAGSGNVLFDTGANASNVSPFIDPPGLSYINSVFFSNTAFNLAIPANDAVLVTLEIDTTGVPLGTYQIQLGQAFGIPVTLSSTTISPHPLVATPSLVNGAWDGSLTIVPEPSSVVMGLFAAAGLAAVVVRRRRRVA